jgi:hypothetical protein
MTLKRSTSQKRTGFSRIARRSDPAGAERVKPRDEAKTSLNRTGTLRKAPLAIVSKRRKAENAPDGAWTVLKALVIERDIKDDRCAVAEHWPEVPKCGGIPDAHHIRRTGKAGGPRLADPRDMMGACRFHHEAIHANMPLAKKRGLLRDSPFVPPEAAK